MVRARWRGSYGNAGAKPLPTRLGIDAATLRRDWKVRSLRLRDLAQKCAIFDCH